MTGDRPDIPSDVKREVRRAAGFGCVICGAPIYQYDHMIEWNVVQTHEASNLVALCPTHHDDKTRGLLPLEEVQKARLAPINLAVGHTSGKAIGYGSAPIVTEIGSSSFTSIAGHSCGVAVAVEDEDLISWSLEDGSYLLSVKWYDEYEKPIFQIVENELVINAGHWDVEFVGKRLIVRSQAGIKQLAVVFDPPAKVRFEQGRFSYRGYDIRFDSEAIRWNGNQLSQLSAVADVGIQFGEASKKKATGFQLG